MARRNTRIATIFGGVWVLLGSAALMFAFSQPVRIHENVDDGRSFQLAGNTHPLIARAQDQGSVDASLSLPRITIHFAMTAGQKKQLQRLLEAQQTRGSKQYHEWLTPEEYADSFGLSEKDLEKVTFWLEEQGFSNIEVARSRTAITFSGTAALAQAAFQTSIHSYLYNGQAHYANQSDPSLPKALEGMVESVRGLNDFHPRPHLRKPMITAINPRYTSSLSGNHFLTPADFATIYDLTPLYNSGIDGTGQKIAVAGQTDIALSDIEAFRAAAGLPANNPTIVLTGRDPGTSSDDLSEADLDLEWSGGVAKNATIIYVNSTDAFTSATYAVDNNVAPVLSISYGNCESMLGTAEVNTLSSTFQQANAQGITVIAPSGDSGAADCDGSTNANGPVVTEATQGLAVDAPASTPYVTGVGGTEFYNDPDGTPGTYWAAAPSTNNPSNNGTALSYIPEEAWNDTSTTDGLDASGGGKSTIFPKPSWQVGPGVPNDSARDVPDIAIDASPNHDGYLICSGGSCVNYFRMANTYLNVVGGTSMGPPTFAGIVALLNQQLGGSQGNINKTLYSLASYSSDAFHDITTGNNIVPCKEGTPDCPAASPFQFGYSAGTGYDQVTGLGSVDAYHLVHEWTSDFQASINPTTLTVTRGSSGTATVTITPVDNFTGAVSFTCSVPAALTDTTCSIPGTVSSSGNATLTITASTVSAAPGRFRWRGFGTGGGAALALGGTLLLFCGMAGFLWPRRRGQALSGAFAILLLTTMTSCGDGTSASTTAETVQPASETADVTVTATAGVLSHSVTVSITVP
ncbi:MAG: S53 family peptidase [Bryobacteraceae bacterium]